MDVIAEIQVSGLTEGVETDFLLLYFENKRRSGGGEIQTITRNRSTAIITFIDPADAAGVLSRAGHRLQGAELEVRRPPPWDPRKMMFCGLDVNTEEALLELYVEAVSGRDSVTIIQSKDRNSALLSFQEELSDEDFLRLESRVKEKRLLGREISVRRVRSSGDVLVEDLGSGISLDLLEMYFESKRSGGGAVTSVTFLRGNSAAIVSFRDWRVADEVLCRSHILQNCRLSVSRYHPDLIETAKSPDPESSQVIGAPDQQTPPPPQTQPNDQQTPPPPPLPSPPPTQLYHMAEETADHVQRIRPEVSQIRPEVSQIRPEVSQIRPHCQDLCSPVYGNERTLSCHDTPDKGDRDADPGGSSMVWEAEGVTPVQEAEGVTPVQEEEVVMEEAELLFMQRYRHDLLAGMNNVTIFPLEERDKSGFKVIGDAFSCKTAVEVLQHVVSSLSSRSITLDYPGVSHFLLEREGKCTLRDIENHHQCIIDTSQISWNPLDCQFVDPWSLIGDTSSPELSDVQSMMIDEEPGDRSLHADLEGIKMFASLLKSEESAGDNLTNENKTSIGRKIEEDDLEEDLYTDRSLDLTSNQVKDEELQQVCEMSRKEFQERQLDEEAQILLAIQRSMDSRGISVQEEEEEDLQRALEMSLIQNESEDTEESLQRALEMSLQDQRSHDFQGSHDFHEPIAVSEDPASLQHMEATLDVVTLRVLAGDETGIVVASAALRKAITSKLNTVILEAMEGLQNISPIMAALHKKHKVKITESGRELQIQGFLQRPNQCRQEMSEILNILHSRDQTLNRVQSQASADVMKMDTDIDVQMTDVSETSEEYQHVTQPFLDTLRDLQPSIEILQVQKIHNPLLYNQYQLKKLRTVMRDPNQPAERILYHGTSESSAKEICYTGFNRSFSGKNAALYGQGVYFAVESEVSARDHFSPPNQDGKKFVLVSLVLTGEFTQGKENMKTPPTMPSAKGEEPRRYHSLVNNMTSPAFYVIFNDTQAYPQYLITCRKYPTGGKSYPGGGATPLPTPRPSPNTSSPAATTRPPV